MKILGINFGKEKVLEKKPEQIEIKPEPKQPANQVESFQFYSQNEYMPPTGSYWPQNGYIRWGYNNLFPLQLADLFNSSPIHASITQQKAKMIIGEGLKYDEALLTGLTVMQTAELNRFTNFADGQEKSLQQIAGELELDYQIFGAMAVEVFWSSDFTKIIKINRLPVVNIRIGEEDDFGKVNEYYYNKDWSRPTYYGITTIPAFNVLNKTTQSQVLYVKNPSIDGRYYGAPTYASGLNWIATDAANSKFCLSNVQNGMSPSLAIQFYKLPESPEHRHKLVSDFKREYSSQHNAGKCMVFFSDGKDLAPDVKPIEIANIDKTMVAINEQVVEQIVRAHRAVSGILFGIQTIARITAVNEYEQAYLIFEKTVLTSDRRVLEDMLNRILRINQLNVGLKFEPFQVFNTQLQKQ